MNEVIIPIMISALWSLNPAIISKLSKDSPPMFFTSIRALIALLFLLLVLPLVELLELPYMSIIIIARPGSLPLSVLVAIVLSAITGPGLGDAFYVKAIQTLGGSLAVIISYTYIFFTSIFAAILEVEYLTTWMLIGSIIAFMGVVIAVSSNSFTLKASGIVYALLASVNWGIATVLIRLARDYVNPIALSIVRLAIVFLVMLVLSSILHETLKVDKNFMIATSITGVLGWGIGMVLFVYSIYRIGPSMTAIATALTPILSQITTKTIGGEKLSVRVLLGATLVTLGIIYASL